MSTQHDTAMALVNDVAENSGDASGNAADTSGPPGTYGCACVSRDARNCALLRYGYHECGDFACECMCHQWNDEDD